MTLRYWAAARAAAGASEDRVEGATLADALSAARRAHPDNSHFDQVLAVCSFLVGETPVASRDPASVPLVTGAIVDVLPPFAGG